MKCSIQGQIATIGVGISLGVGLLWAGDLNIDGNLKVQGSLSVSGAVTGIQMPVAPSTDAKDAANRGFVETMVQTRASTNHSHTQLANSLDVIGSLSVASNLTAAAISNNQLRVVGQAQFDGPVNVEPHGDISMGVFTNR